MRFTTRLVIRYISSKKWSIKHIFEYLKSLYLYGFISKRAYIKLGKYFLLKKSKRIKKRKKIIKGKWVYTNDYFEQLENEFNETIELTSVSKRNFFDKYIHNLYKVVSYDKRISNFRVKQIRYYLLFRAKSNYNYDGERIDYNKDSLYLICYNTRVKYNTTFKELIIKHNSPLIVEDIKKKIKGYENLYKKVYEKYKFNRKEVERIKKILRMIKKYKINNLKKQKQLLLKKYNFLTIVIKRLTKLRDYKRLSLSLKYRKSVYNKLIKVSYLIKISSVEFNFRLEKYYKQNKRLRFLMNEYFYKKNKLDSYVPFFDDLNLFKKENGRYMTETEFVWWQHFLSSNVFDYVRYIGCEYLK